MQHKRFCLFSGCDKTPKYCLKDKNKSTHCFYHKTEFMKQSNRKICNVDDCLIVASLRNPDDVFPTRCGEHKTSTMVCAVREKCKKEGCYTRASYGFKDKTPEFCTTHKLKEMITVRYRKCNGEKCLKSPAFNFPGEKRGMYCNDHKLVNMVNVVTKIIPCFYENCSNKAPFRDIENIKIRYCKEHKKTDSFIKKHHLCMGDECFRKASYNFPGNTKKLYCSTHCLDGMIDLSHKLCKEKDCNKYPGFNFIGEKPLYCQDHLKPNMVDVLNRKKCQGKECSKFPSFNFPDQISKIYCKEHSLPGMVILEGKKCRIVGCKAKADFGFSGKKALFCLDHKKNLMINLKLENKCSNCDKAHDVISKDVKYCKDCVPEDDHLNIVKRLCKYCDIRENSSYICGECKLVTNKKEWSIVRHLRINIKEDLIYDSTQILQGCSMKRPDICYDLPDKCVIIEVDENQHKTYDSTCECARINEIVNGIGGRPVTFIRYNPDVVRNKTKALKIDPAARIDLLVKTVDEEIKATPDSFKVKMIQLFYDDSYDVYERYKMEDITDKVAV